MEYFIILGLIFCIFNKDRGVRRYEKNTAALRAKYGITNDDYDDDC